jgi:hypothetical protein
MKKMYNQPIVEHVEMMPQSVICASNPTITDGGDTTNDVFGGGAPLGD